MMGKHLIYAFYIFAGLLIISPQLVTTSTQAYPTKNNPTTENVTISFRNESDLSTLPTVNTNYTSLEQLTVSSPAIKLVNGEKNIVSTTASTTSVSLSTNIALTSHGNFTESEDTKETIFLASTSPATTTTTGTKETTFLASSSPAPTTTTDNSVSEPEKKSDYSWVVIIIIVILIAVILLILIVCLVKNKDRRYSFDLYHKSPEDAGIPLNTVEGEGTAAQISADDIKEKKPVDNETKLPTDSTTAVNVVQVEKLEAAPADIEIPLDNAEEGNQKKEHDQCSLDLSEACLLSDMEKVTKAKKAKNEDDNDDSSTHSAKTSQETLQDTQNDNNNNNNSSVIAMGLNKGRKSKALYTLPDDNPDFTVMTCWKNDSKHFSPSVERRLMDYMTHTPRDMPNQNGDIICVRIMQKDNAEEGTGYCSTGQAEFSQDNTFTEVQLHQFE